MKRKKSITTTRRNVENLISHYGREPGKGRYISRLKELLKAGSLELTRSKMDKEIENDINFANDLTR